MEKSPNQQCNLLSQWLDRADLGPGRSRLETVWEDEDDDDEEKEEEEERWEVGGAGVCDVILPGGLTQGSHCHPVTLAGSQENNINTEARILSVL